MELLPVAITRVEGGGGCVAARTRDGSWIRPRPVSEDQVTGVGARYLYGRWTEVDLGEHLVNERIEDRPVRSVPELRGVVDRTEWRAAIVAACDSSVANAFSSGRTAGMVKVQVDEIYARRHLRGRWFVRMKFTDGQGEHYDWIVPEVRMVDLVAPMIAAGQLPTAFAQQLRGVLSGDVFLAIGLTLPNDRMPGQFGGCHPLVVGVHSFPDYVDQLLTGEGRPNA